MPVVPAAASVWQLPQPAVGEDRLAVGAAAGCPSPFRRPSRCRRPPVSSAARRTGSAGDGGDVGSHRVGVLAGDEVGRHPRQRRWAAPRWGTRSGRARPTGSSTRRARRRATARNASSRFGPITPVVPASASVWQTPHFSMKSSLPRVAVAAPCLRGPDRAAAGRSESRERGARTRARASRARRHARRSSRSRARRRPLRASRGS